MTHTAAEKSQCRECGALANTFSFVSGFNEFRATNAPYIYSMLFLNVFRDSLNPEEERRDMLRAGWCNASEDPEIRSWMPAIS